MFIFSLLSESITAARRLVTDNWHRWTLAWRSSWGEGEKLKRLRLEKSQSEYKSNVTVFEPPKTYIYIFVYRYIDLFATEATINHWYLLTVTPLTLNSLDSTTFCEGLNLNFEAGRAASCFSPRADFQQVYLTGHLSTLRGGENGSVYHLKVGIAMVAWQILTG